MWGESHTRDVSPPHPGEFLAPFDQVPEFVLEQDTFIAMRSRCFVVKARAVLALGLKQRERKCEIRLPFVVCVTRGPVCSYLASVALLKLSRPVQATDASP